MTLTIHSIEQIDEAAQEFLTLMGDKRIFAFYGGMGVGKTTFIKALCEQLGVKGQVASPTFAIVNEYSPGPIFHFDFYRLKNLDEARDIGLDDYLYSGNICLMEWPEVVEPLLPEDTVKVQLEELPDGTREINICPLNSL